MAKAVKVVLVAGARPNFVKIAPLIREMRKTPGLNPTLVHTGQHYDDEMSRRFFCDLEIPEPDVHLGVGSGSHGVQTARILEGFEKVLKDQAPRLVVVVGDVNSTLACGLAAANLNIPVAHVEAGLRSRDWFMPEEVNRVLTDRLSSLLFVPEPAGLENLKAEGFTNVYTWDNPDLPKPGFPSPPEKALVVHVGNVMIDSLMYALPRILESTIRTDMNLSVGKYGMVTLHRPANVDGPQRLIELINWLNRLSEILPLVFPVHPRTRSALKEFGFADRFSKQVKVTDPLGYLDFLALVKEARLVITDSGGIQEETTRLGVPCVTLRSSTERPITVAMGTNHLAGMDLGKAGEIVDGILEGKEKQGQVPELWDGKAAERIIRVIEKVMG
jgi:UDP-N-acetylglucosamine 2-epimerase (non-hydrolysing)